MLGINSLYFSTLNTAASTTKDALNHTATYGILSTWWNTPIAISVFVASLVISIFGSFILYFFKNYLQQVNEKFPFIRPLLSCICVIAASAIGWLIEMFGRNDDIQLTYFSISIQTLVGRWAFEGLVHGWAIASHGLIYICAMHIFGIFFGILISQLIILKATTMSKNKQVNVRSTFGYVPSKTKPHLYKSMIVWLVTGATVPFIGYLVYVRSSGQPVFSFFTSVLLTLVVIFVMMSLTHRVGYYDENLIFSLWLAFTNIAILKAVPKKQYYINSLISAFFGLGYPIFWGVIYAVIYLTS